jgi:hypothetical protein
MEYDMAGITCVEHGERLQVLEGRSLQSATADAQIIEHLECIKKDISGFGNRLREIGEKQEAHSEQLKVLVDDHEKRKEVVKKVKTLTWAAVSAGVLGVLGKVGAMLLTKVPL